MFSTLVLATLLLALASVEAKKLTVITGPWERSERWDDYIEALTREADLNRIKRSKDTPIPTNTPCGWQHSKTQCSRMNYYEADSLHRRSPLNSNGPSSSLLAPPQQQGSCGSCWAFATVNAITDQLSLRDGTRTSLLSSQYLTTCLTNLDLVGGNGNGCCGGLIHAGVNLIARNGIVDSTCVPYSLETYDFDNKPRLPTCPTSCISGSTFNPSTYMLMDYQVLKSDDEIITALNEGFMVKVTMLISDEFKCVYQCGIYCESENSKMRRKLRRPRAHAVVIVDYGTQNQIPFWVVKNSWGDGKHENGYFRIKRGELEIGRGDEAIKYLINSRSTTSDRADHQNLMTCAIESVSNPTSNPAVMSAAEMLLNILVGQSQVPPCSDGTMVTQLTLEEITNATIQEVAGTAVAFDLIARTNCIQDGKTVKARISAAVYITLNGTFELSEYPDYTTFVPGTSGNRATAINSWLVIAISILLASMQLLL